MENGYQHEYCKYIIPSSSITRDPYTFHRIWAKIIKDTGIKGSIDLTRNTFATMCLNNDIPIKVVSTMLGHSSVIVTEKHYAYLLTEKIEEEIIKIPSGLYEPVDLCWNPVEVVRTFPT